MDLRIQCAKTKGGVSIAIVAGSSQSSARTISSRWGGNSRNAPPGSGRSSGLVRRQVPTRMWRWSYSPKCGASPQPDAVVTATKATANRASAMRRPTAGMRIRDAMGTSSCLLYPLPEYGLRGAGAVTAITISAMKLITVSGRGAPCFW